jgi:hypothetical protein
MAGCGNFVGTIDDNTLNKSKFIGNWYTKADTGARKWYSIINDTGTIVECDLITFTADSALTTIFMYFIKDTALSSVYYLPGSKYYPWSATNDTIKMKNITIAADKTMAYSIETQGNIKRLVFNYTGDIKQDTNYNFIGDKTFENGHKILYQ